MLHHVGLVDITIETCVHKNSVRIRFHLKHVSLPWFVCKYKSFIQEMTSVDSWCKCNSFFTLEVSKIFFTPPSSCILFPALMCNLKEGLQSLPWKECRACLCEENVNTWRLSTYSNYLSLLIVSLQKTV